MNKLSAVILSRNDENNFNNNYERSVYCINSFTKHFDEVVLVDWNSPTPLINLLEPSLIKRGNLRIVEVPCEFINDVIKQKHSDIPIVCKVLGKNVGIRRASGDFILNTNIDIISPERKNIDKFTFDKNTMYTSARINVSLSTVLNYTKINELYDYLNTNKHLLHRERTHINNDSELSADFYSKVNCCGDFQFASRAVYNEIRGYEESAVYRNYADTNLQIKAYNNGSKIEAIDLPYFHLNHLDRALSVKSFNDWSLYGDTKFTTQNTENWGYINETFNEIKL